MLNASERRGLADEVRDTLTQLGFTVDGIGNAEPTQRTTIRFTPDNAQQAERLAASVPAAVLTPDTAVPGGLQLVLGKGFDGVVRPPSEAGAPGGGSRLLRLRSCVGLSAFMLGSLFHADRVTAAGIGSAACGRPIKLSWTPLPTTSPTCACELARR